MKNIDGNIIVNGDIQSGKTTNLIFNTIDSIIDKKPTGGGAFNTTINQWGNDVNQELEI